MAFHEEWSRLIDGEGFSLPDEVPATHTYSEGAQRLITINSYERNPAARNACIAHYGVACAVFYGSHSVTNMGPSARMLFTFTIWCRCPKSRLVRTRSDQGLHRFARIATQSFTCSSGVYNRCGQGYDQSITKRWSRCREPNLLITRKAGVRKTEPRLWRFRGPVTAPGPPSGISLLFERSPPRPR